MEEDYNIDKTVDVSNPIMKGAMVRRAGKTIDMIVKSVLDMKNPKAKGSEKKAIEVQKQHRGVYLKNLEGDLEDPGVINYLEIVPDVKGILNKISMATYGMMSTTNHDEKNWKVQKSI